VSLPFAFFDEIFETCASICGVCFSSETDSQGSQDSRFPGSVVSNDEIDPFAKVDFQTFVTLDTIRSMGSGVNTMKLNNSIDLMATGESSI
jgi:hypothetical protein